MAAISLFIICVTFIITINVDVQYVTEISRVSCELQLRNLGVWVILGTSVTHMVCQQMRILNNSFAYFFRLAIITKANILNSLWGRVMKLGMWVG